MARFTASARTGAGSPTLPIISVYSIATAVPRVVEIGVFNTSVTSVALMISKFTTAGTPGAGLTETKYDPQSAAADCTAFTTHTVAPTLGDPMHRFMLGAAIGAGAIFTFYDEPIKIPVATTNGIGLIVATGTGQVCDAYITWDE